MENNKPTAGPSRVGPPMQKSLMVGILDHKGSGRNVYYMVLWSDGIKSRVKYADIKDTTKI